MTQNYGNEYKTKVGTTVNTRPYLELGRRAKKLSTPEEMVALLPALLGPYLDQLRMQNSWNF